MLRVITSSLLIVALSGCGPTGPEPGPGGVSIDDAKQLDAAAAKIDARSSVDETTISDSAEEAPAKTTAQ